MKTTLKYLIIVALAVVPLTWLAVRATSTEGEDDGHGFDEHIDARDAFRHLQLQDENGQIPPNGLIDAYKQKQNMPFLAQAWAEFMQSSQPTLTGSKPGDLQASDPGVLIDIGSEPDVPNPEPWVSIGPGNIGGRIRSMIIKPPDPIHPEADRTIWVGAVSGGVWKTTNGGVSWSTTTDFLANIGVNCMAIDPQDPNTLYAGTGEVFRGNGIFKTVDGGTTWTRLNSTNNPDFYYVYSLAVSPTNSQLLLAAVSSDKYNGKIYRSTDAGENWSLTETPTTTQVTNVHFHPTDGNKCIAGVGNSDNVLYSINGGMTWTLASGLPIPSGRIELAYARSDPTKVYASVSADNGQLYVSFDEGHSFINTVPGHLFSGTTAGGYANALWVDPIDANTVLAGGAYLYRSTNGGATWEEASTTSIHVDHHVIVEDPGYNRGIGGNGNPGNAMVYGGNDGGIHLANNILYPCPSPGNCVTGIGWKRLNNDLAITQFYGAAAHVGPPGDKIIGGTQDNGTLVDHNVFNDWRMMAGALGGDGGFCAADQTSDPYFYGEFFFIQIYRSIDGGDTKQYIYNGIADANHSDATGFYANAVAPFILDSNDQFGTTMLAGGRRLWRSTNVRDSQPSWAAIKDETQATAELRNISAIAVAPGNSNIIWVGHNDGSVYYTTNGMDADPTWTSGDPSNMLPGGPDEPQHPRMCTRITIGQVDGGLPRKVYVTFSGFFPSPTDSRGNVWKTEDNGLTWVDRSNGLPSAPMYSLVISPFNPARLYVGTEVGVFASPDGGATWSPGDRGPANVPVLELFWMGPKLVAATHGRGIFTIGPADH